MIDALKPKPMNMYNQTFEQQLLIEHNSRIQRESWERHCKQVRG